MALHATAKHVFLYDSSRRRIGIIIGTAIDPKRMRVLYGDEVASFTGERNAEHYAASFERWLYELCGSFLCIVSTDTLRRIYLDAAGTRSLVFMRDKRLSASSSGLLLTDKEYQDRFDVASYRALDVTHYGWFPGGLAAHHGVERLIANHYLDLNDWTVHRHWPRNDFMPTGNTDSQARQLVKSLIGTIGPLINAGRVVAALTAGQDSRLILAALRSYRHSVSFYTIALEQSALDVLTAWQLGRRFSLRHAAYPRIRAAPSEIRHWRYMSSHCVGGTNAHAHPADRSLNGFDFILGGQGGELARDYLWWPSDGPDTRVDAKELLGRLGLPHLPRAVARVSEWLEEVKSFSIYTQLALAYLELRLSSWAFASAYAQNPAVTYICPFLSRSAIDVMLSVPPEARRKACVMQKAIRASWAELLEIPINRYGDYRDLAAKLALLKDIPRVRQKIRKLRAANGRALKAVT